MIKFLMLVLMTSILTSCASRTEGWFQLGNKVELSKKEVLTLSAKAEKLWKKRGDKASLEEALKIYETLSNGTTDNLNYLVRLTRGYYFLADAHYTDMDEKKKYWEVGTSYGEKALATNKAFADAMKKGEKIEDHLNKLGKKEVPAMYWTAANLGKWAKNTGIATTLKYKNRIRTLADTVRTLQPDYFYGAAYRYFGAYYAVAPGFAGGDMNKSKENFKKALKVAPEYLGTHVLYADLYAVKMGDKKLFKDTLNKVLKMGLGPKELHPENIVEKEKAKKLLAQMEDKF